MMIMMMMMMMMMIPHFEYKMTVSELMPRAVGQGAQATCKARKVKLYLCVCVVFTAHCKIRVTYTVCTGPCVCSVSQCGRLLQC